MSEHRFGIFVETGAKDLAKDRTLFRFGKRVEALILSNGSASARTFDVQVARDPTFYWPDSPFNAQASRTEISQETYFYARVPANDTRTFGPFFAPRGLKVKRQGGTACHVSAILQGVEEGEVTVKDIG